jgi:hypothetical protein
MDFDVGRGSFFFFIPANIFRRNYSMVIQYAELMLET